MTTQQLTTGGDDFIVLRGELQNFKTLKVTVFQIVVKDNYAVASFSDVSLARKMVKAEIKSGNKNIKYAEKINSVIEKYPGKKMKEIAKIIAKKLQDGGAKLKK